MRLLKALVLIGVVLALVTGASDVDGKRKRKNKRRKNKHKPVVKVISTTPAVDLEKIDEESGVSEAERLLSKVLDLV